jgi:hypothetical protein
LKFKNVEYSGLLKANTIQKKNGKSLSIFNQP